jgi:hypothetical protein
LASNKTPNLLLNEWSPQDRFRLTEINANFRTIDDKIGILFDESSRFPLATFEFPNEVVKKNLPYFHVERYGAKGDYNPSDGTGTDDTLAIQRAIDAAIRAEGGVIVFERKNYKITDTIYINPTSSNIPIVLKGVNSSLWRGSTIYKETEGDFFRVNVKSDGSTFLDPAAQYYHFFVENLTLFSNTKTAGNGFHMFRTRSKMQNIFSYGLERLVYQPSTDSLGNANYCDMSEYRNIAINYPRTSGLELNKPDGSKIERIYVHYPESTCGSYIIVRNGGSFNISNCVFAWHMNNDGEGISSDKAYIKVSGAYSFTIDNIYVERTHMSNMIYLNDCKNFSITSVYERFVGNNAFHLKDSHDGVIEGIYRHSSLNEGYCDIYFTGANSNITIRRFRIRDYTTDTKRELNLQGTLPSEIQGEIVTIGIYYDGTSWKVVDFLGNDVSSKFGTPVWTNNDGIEFPSTSIIRYGKVIALQPRYVNASTMPHVPTFNVPNTKRIAFYDRSTGQRTQTQSTQMSCMLTISVPMSV